MSLSKSTPKNQTTMNLEPRAISALAQIRNSAWMASPSHVREYASRLAAMPESMLDYDDFYNPRQPMTMDNDGIAVIHVAGMLLDEAPPIYEKLGLATTYPTLIAELEQAVEVGAQGICLVINSGGGHVSGNIEAAKAVKSVGIPTVAFCKGMACSAAYAIASQADSILATPSATVGNIGTILSWPDDDEFWRMMGIEWKAMTNQGADLKSTFHTEPDAAQLAFLQEELDQMGADFQQLVAEARPEIDPETNRAGWYYGDKAEALGIIDGQGNMQDAIDALRSQIAAI